MLEERVGSSSWGRDIAQLAQHLHIDAPPSFKAALNKPFHGAQQVAWEASSDDRSLAAQFARSPQGQRSLPAGYSSTLTATLRMRIAEHVIEANDGSHSVLRPHLQMLRELLTSAIQLVTAERPDRSFPLPELQCPKMLAKNPRLEIRLKCEDPAHARNLTSLLGLLGFDGAELSNVTEMAAIVPEASIQSRGDALGFATFAVRIMVNNAQVPDGDRLLREAVSRLHDPLQPHPTSQRAEPPPPSRA
jgi:hypothetical protein